MARGRKPGDILKHIRRRGLRRHPRAARLVLRCRVRRQPLGQGRGGGAAHKAGVAGRQRSGRARRAARAAAVQERRGPLGVRPGAELCRHRAPQGAQRQEREGSAASRRAARQGQLRHPARHRRAVLLRLHHARRRRGGAVAAAVHLLRLPLRAGGRGRACGRGQPGRAAGDCRHRGIAHVQQRRRGGNVRLLEATLQPDVQPDRLGHAQQHGEPAHRLSPPREAWLAGAEPPDAVLNAVPLRHEGHLRRPDGQHGRLAARGRLHTHHSAGVCALQRRLRGHAGVGQRVHHLPVVFLQVVWRQQPHRAPLPGHAALLRLPHGPQQRPHRGLRAWRLV